MKNLLIAALPLLLAACASTSTPDYDLRFGEAVRNARLQQTLGNLLENASRYASSRVDVTLSTADGEALVTVDDDGPGIAPEDRPHVFDRLYASRGTGGSGLGLAIVRQLTEAMHGSVNVGDSPHGGARLEVRLPLRGPA